MLNIVEIQHSDRILSAVGQLMLDARQSIGSIIPVLIAIISWFVAWKIYVKQKQKEVRLDHLKESYFLLKDVTPLFKEADSLQDLPDHSKDKVRGKAIELKRQAILGMARAVNNIQLYGTDKELDAASNITKKNKIDFEEIDKVLAILRADLHREIGHKSLRKYDSKWVGFIHRKEDYE